MKVEFFVRFIVADSLISGLVNMLAGTPVPFLFFASFFRLIAVLLAAVVCYYLGNALRLLSLRACWVYCVVYVIGYLLIGFFFHVLFGSIDLFDTFYRMHTTSLYIIVYVPYTLSPLMFIVTRRWSWLDI